MNKREFIDYNELKKETFEILDNKKQRNIWKYLKSPNLKIYNCSLEIYRKIVYSNFHRKWE